VEGEKKKKKVSDACHALGNGKKETPALSMYSKIPIMQAMACFVINT
jgi:hypothetical protein